VTGIVSNSTSEQELAAFNELQNYANFQNDLSTRVLDDIMKDQSRTIEEAPRWTRGGLLPEEFMSNDNRPQYEILPRPIFIQQQVDSVGRRIWSRNFDTSLEQCGVTQQIFFEFIDTLNQYLKVRL
jgi:hypothetical protein